MSTLRPNKYAVKTPVPVCGQHLCSVRLRSTSGRLRLRERQLVGVCPSGCVSNEKSLKDLEREKLFSWETSKNHHSSSRINSYLRSQAGIGWPQSAAPVSVRTPPDVKEASCGQAASSPSSPLHRPQAEGGRAGHTHTASEAY